MRVLVTGAAGMLGRSLMSRFAEDDSVEAIGLSRADFDLRDSRAATEFFRATKPDVVIHAAAKVGGIQANLAEPFDFLANNIDLDSSVIKASIQAGVRNFLYLGSSCMYPKDYRQPLRETDLLAAPLESTNEGYALAKIVGSKLCDYASQEHGAFYKTLIPSNLYGPGDSFSTSSSHLVASVVRKVHLAKMTRNPEIEVWGSGAARREFTYIKDLANWIAGNLHNIGALPPRLNLGVGYDLSVNDYYKKIAEILGVEIVLKHDKSKPDGMKSKLMDSTIASTRFGWQPEFTLESGIPETYESFLRTNEDAR